MFIGYGFVMFCLKNRHYIYQRFRIGHFSRMMWFGLSSLVVQLAVIGFSMYLGIIVVAPALLTEGVVAGLLFRNFMTFKKLQRKELER